MSGAAYWLPVIFAGLLALSMLIYVVLDGYDLGVGLLLPFANDEQKNLMVSSIGPFWDANETWLVLGVGLLLIAFPLANGIILGELYIPVALMLLGLIVRGVAFDFRVKARDPHKVWWNRAFFGGSLLASIMQGIMLGRYLVGFAGGTLNWIFAILVGLGLAFAYALLGAGWLLMKTNGDLQSKAIRWMRGSVFWVALALLLVSIVTPLASQHIADKWFVLPQFFLLLPLPVLCVILFGIIWFMLGRLRHRPEEQRNPFLWIPFVCTLAVILLSFIGLGYSVFPDLVIGQVDIWSAASSTSSLWIILIGAIIVLPFIILYTIFVYWVFWGRVEELTY